MRETLLMVVKNNSKTIRADLFSRFWTEIWKVLFSFVSACVRKLLIIILIQKQIRMNCFWIEKQLKNNYFRIVFPFLEALETKLNEFVSLNLCNLLIIRRIEKQFCINCFWIDFELFLSRKTKKKQFEPICFHVYFWFVSLNVRNCLIIKLC